MYTIGPLISPQPQSPPGFSTTFPDFSWISRKQEVKQNNLKLPWAPNPLKWHHPKQKKRPRIHSWQPRLAFTTGSHAFGWQLFYRFWVYWLDNLIGKLLSGFQLGNHQVCLKYWKILKGPKYLRNKDFPTFHGWIFGAHFCFWDPWNIKDCKEPKSIQAFSTFWYLNQNHHLNFEILKLKYSGILMGGGSSEGDT